MFARPEGMPPCCVGFMRGGFASAEETKGLSVAFGNFSRTYIMVWSPVVPVGANCVRPPRGHAAVLYGVHARGFASAEATKGLSIAFGNFSRTF